MKLYLVKGHMHFGDHKTITATQIFKASDPDSARIMMGRYCEDLLRACTMAPHIDRIFPEIVEEYDTIDEALAA